MTESEESDEKYEEYNLKPCPYWGPIGRSDDCVRYRPGYDGNWHSSYYIDAAQRKTCMNYDAANDMYCEGSREEKQDIRCSELFLISSLIIIFIYYD